VSNAQPSIHTIHFIGIGGAGMSGLALVAHTRGFAVSGSDLKESRYMRALQRAGIPVTVGHSAANVADAAIDVVVISTAIPPVNPELVAAQKRGIPVWPRAQMLAYLGRGHKTLAVSGTHGKTTTSSMLATALARLDANPTFLIGGIVDGFNATAYAGTGDYFVVEADESDGSFTYLDPALTVITNIEADHLDHYKDLAAINAAFAGFSWQAGRGGLGRSLCQQPRSRGVGAAKWQALLDLWHSCRRGRGPGRRCPLGAL